MQFEVSGSRLRLNYDFFTFTYGCGTVDHVVCPALSEYFWEEIVGLVSRRERRLGMVKDRFKTNSVVFQASKRHHMEIDSLISLLVGVLAGRESPGYVSPGLRKPVRKLCAGLRPVRGHENNAQALTGDQKLLLQRIRSAVKKMAIMRVQATMGYYWAIGPPNLVKGDWSMPIIAQGERVPRRPETRITRFMFLRPINPKAQKDTWYPSATSDPEGRLRGLLGFRMAGVDAVHVTAKFADAGGSCLLSFDYNIRHDTVMWRVLWQATVVANQRGLPALSSILSELGKVAALRAAISSTCLTKCICG
ncbi:HET domain-containing protein [Diaporthe eres]|nr:HET domain-containing protein [Diaporthe eres]